MPVLTARNRVEEFLIDGETALLFARRDAAKLTVKLTSLLDGRAAARAMAEHALRHVQEAQSPADMVTAGMRVYRSAM